MLNKIEKNEITASLIIPAYNNVLLLSKNLPEIIAASKYQANKIIEIIVVDDASLDNTQNYVKGNYPMVRLIKHSINRGFPSSVNTGVRVAKGKFLILLNSDVLPTKNFMENVYDNFEDNSVFAVSLHEDGESWASAKFRDGCLFQERGKTQNSVHDSFWASGGSAVFRRDYWLKLGGFDDKLYSPFYKEDLDLSYRALKRGFRILWEPKALVYHKHESTISKLSKKYVDRVKGRNELLFHWKNITSRNMFRKHLAGVFLRAISHPGYFKVILSALAKLNLVVRERKKEILGSRVSDESIFAKFS